jgi:protoporphyrinogen oxidase
MGLAVAYQLIKEGCKPILFEADDRVGGMTAAFDFGGLSIERYYHFHCVSDKAFLEILDELGLADKMRWTETKMGYFYERQVHPWGNPLALLKFRGLNLLSKFRYGLHVFCSTKRNNWKGLDAKEASSWIKSWIGDEAYEILWRRLFDYKFYEYANQLSAAWIWSRIRRTGRSRYDLFREKLGHLEGGSEVLLQALKSFIESQGGEIRLKQPISRVVIENNAVKGVESGGKFEKFSKVVSTVPLPYLPQLMPDLSASILNAYRSVKNIAVVCVIAKLKRKVTENFWLNVNDPEMDIPGLVEYTNLRPLSEHIVYVPFYMPGEHPKFLEPNQNFLDKVQRYLRIINPELQSEDFIEMRASRYRYAQPICMPGHLKSLPPAKLPTEGLWAADTSYYYPEDRGISESIEFGRKLAKEVANSHV